MSKVQEARKAVNNLPWIRINDGAPKDKESVLCILKSPICTTARICIYFAKRGNMYEPDWDGVGFYDYDSEYGYYKMDDIIAWLPLPNFGKDDSNG